MYQELLLNKKLCYKQLLKRNFVTEEPHLLISHTALKESILEDNSYLFKGGNT